MGFVFYSSGGNDAGDRDNQAPIRKTKRTSRISLYDLQQETFELGLNISRGTDDIRDTSSTYDTAMVGLTSSLGSGVELSSTAGMVNPLSSMRGSGQPANNEASGAGTRALTVAEKSAKYASKREVLQVRILVQRYRACFMPALMLCSALDRCYRGTDYTT